jgi:hypothetical protein
LEIGLAKPPISARPSRLIIGRQVTNLPNKKTSDASSISAVAALNPLNTGFSTEPVPVSAVVGQINSVWQAKTAIPLTSLGPSLQLALAVNGVVLRLWLSG